MSLESSGNRKPILYVPRGACVVTAPATIGAGGVPRFTISRAQGRGAGGKGRPGGRPEAPPARRRPDHWGAAPARRAAAARAPLHRGRAVLRQSVDGADRGP